jgi:hypothetical protein
MQVDDLEQLRVTVLPVVTVADPLHSAAQQVGVDQVVFEER